MEIRVNPTRMELTRLKKRLKVAQRGHKLLKDKQDELIKKFIDLVKKNKELREEVEKELTSAFNNFVMARAVMSGEILEESLMYPVGKVDIDIARKNIMSVITPVIKVKQQDEEQKKNIYSYGFANTSGELDNAINILSGILPKLLELAEVEKTCQLMAAEIEKTRRRVNALEHIMIPQMIEKIKYITMKLDENERGNLTRLMKIKEMVMVEGSV
ncbi:MAG: V/A-type H+/Na+-transporting ATPase subunit [Thermosediminibacterales bacterium]|nr:V/A-type H+/Na+-transporting ATPase subunit [Thermosediminibacterales bacterium]MDK2836006.1 V/A-type H+/Na+-transporting ATPase subunit [Thermosediminibacterales bacterium]